MIPYGTLSLVGIHAQWVAPVYLRATAPVARRSLMRMKKVVVYIPGSRKAARSLVRVGKVARLAHPRKLAGPVAKVARLPKAPGRKIPSGARHRPVPKGAPKRRRIKSGVRRGGRT